MDQIETSETRPAFSAANRGGTLEAIGREPLDMLVIGGGINGAGIARDAALRGLRVALVDKGDFAGGTSSRSSKLIHGGLRYLELGNLRLVFTACQERDLLRRRLAPHLVRPLPFLLPVYKGDRRGLAAISLGLWLYDLLAAFRNIRRHERLSRNATLAREPALRATGLVGAGFYYDCWTDDARLTLETVLSARRDGALVCNYVEVADFHRSGGRVDGVLLRDTLDDSTRAVRAAVVVNATGPWADALRRLDDPGASPVLRLTKGTHIVVPRQRVGNRNAVVLRGPRDGRVMFAIPWGEQTLVGTTDTDYDGDLDAVRPERADVDYLVEAVSHAFAGCHLTVDDIVSAFAGLRPLVARSTGAAGSPSGLSREEQIVVSQSGLITLAGGKITTYRRVAARVVDRAIEQLRRRGDGRRFSKSRTHLEPLVGADGTVGEGTSRVDRDVGSEHLIARYGGRVRRLLDLMNGDRMNGDRRLQEPLLPPGEDLRGEVCIAATEEMAVHVEDVLRRRLHVALRDPDQGVGVVRDVVEIMAGVLGWDERRRAGEEAAYRARVTAEHDSWNAS